MICVRFYFEYSVCESKTSFISHKEETEETAVDVSEFWIWSLYANTPALLMHKLMAFTEETGMCLNEYVLPAF